MKRVRLRCEWDEKMKNKGAMFLEFFWKLCYNIVELIIIISKRIPRQLRRES